MARIRWIEVEADSEAVILEAIGMMIDGGGRHLVRAADPPAALPEQAPAAAELPEPEPVEAAARIVAAKPQRAATARASKAAKTGAGDDGRTLVGKVRWAAERLQTDVTLDRVVDLIGGGHSGGAVRQAMLALMKQGVLTRTGRGVYELVGGGTMAINERRIPAAGDRAKATLDRIADLPDEDQDEE